MAHILIICSENNLLKGSYHLDTTSLTLYGEYESYEDVSPLPTLGYSKDNRPDLKQLTLSLTHVSEAHIPLWFEALDGNSSDKKSFHKTVNAMKEFQASLGKMPDNLLFTVDAAFYTPAKLAQLDQVKWLTRVPANYKEAQFWLTRQDDDIEWEEIDSHNKMYAFNISHEGIKQR